MKTPKVIHFLSTTYLLYLGALPSVATLAILWEYGFSFPFGLFLGGVVAVSVYLAATYSYIKLPSRILPLLILLLDGPIFVILSLRNELNPLAFAIEGYLIDGTDVWIAILLLAFASSLPTRGQRIGSVAFMVIAIGITISLFWPYIQENLWGQLRALWLVIGLFEAIATQYGVFEREDIARTNEDNSILYIVGFLFLWLTAMFAGMILHESEVLMPY